MITDSYTLTSLQFLIIFQVHMVLLVFHLQWLGHVQHVRHHLPTVIVWNSPVEEFISSMMVSPPLLPTCGILFHVLFFQLPSTYLPLKGWSITTLRTRWHDFLSFFFTYKLLSPFFRYLSNLF